MATSASNGHALCMMHAPCSEEFYPFEPRDCATCSAAFAALLEKESLPRLKPELVALFYCFLPCSLDAVYVFATKWLRLPGLLRAATGGTSCGI